jgi:hypothetical protein
VASTVDCQRLARATIYDYGRATLSSRARFVTPGQANYPMFSAISVIGYEMKRKLPALYRSTHSGSNRVPEVIFCE